MLSDTSAAPQAQAHERERAHCKFRDPLCVAYDQASGLKVAMRNYTNSKDEVQMQLFINIFRLSAYFQYNFTLKVVTTQKLAPTREGIEISSLLRHSNNLCMHYVLWLYLDQLRQGTATLCHQAVRVEKKGVRRFQYIWELINQTVLHLSNMNDNIYLTPNTNEHTIQSHTLSKLCV